VRSTFFIFWLMEIGRGAFTKGQKEKGVALLCRALSCEYRVNTVHFKECMAYRVARGFCLWYVVNIIESVSACECGLLMLGIIVESRS